MPMQFSRKVVIPLWFAVFAIATLFAPAANLVFSLFLLVLGLAIPVMVHMLWHDPSVPVGLVARGPDTGRRHAAGR